MGVAGGDDEILIVVDGLTVIVLELVIVPLGVDVDVVELVLVTKVMMLSVLLGVPLRVGIALRVGVLVDELVLEGELVQVGGIVVPSGHVPGQAQGVGDPDPMRQKKPAGQMKAVEFEDPAGQYQPPLHGPSHEELVRTVSGDPHEPAAHSPEQDGRRRPVESP